MSYAWDGNDVESLGIAILAAHGVMWDRVDAGGKSYARRSANGALHYLGGLELGKTRGLDHLLETLTDVLECAERQYLENGMSQELQDAMSQLRVMAQALAGIEPEAPPAAAEPMSDARQSDAPATIQAADEIEECV